MNKYEEITEFVMPYIEKARKQGFIQGFLFGVGAVLIIVGLVLINLK